MIIQSQGHEHEMEPQYGLPERLPEGERVLWQGAPDVAGVALRVFHMRKIALYFAALIALRAGNVLTDGGTAIDALSSLLWPVPLAALALASLFALAWMTARTAVYTLTDQRLVMRIGIVLTLTFNLPLRVIESAALRQGSGAVGDIVVKLGGPDHIAFLHLWPHVRPWRVARPEPMLRCLTDAPHVAQLLAQAWSSATGNAALASMAQPGTTVIAPVATPASATHTADGPAKGQWQPSPT